MEDDLGSEELYFDDLEEKLEGKKKLYRRPQTPFTTEELYSETKASELLEEFQQEQLRLFRSLENRLHHIQKSQNSSLLQYQELLQIIQRQQNLVIGETKRLNSNTSLQIQIIYKHISYSAKILTFLFFTFTLVAVIITAVIA